MLKNEDKTSFIIWWVEIIMLINKFLKKITMNFITNLSSSKWKKVVYDSILIIIDHYMKIIYYLFMKKILTIIKLTKLFFEEVVLRYEILNDVIKSLIKIIYLLMHFDQKSAFMQS